MESVQDLLRMLGWLYRLECLENLPMFVDEKRDPAGRRSFLVEDTVGLANSLLRVREQWERQMEFLRELLVGRGAVHADPKDLGSLIADLLVLVSEATSLDGAARSIVFGVEVEDEFLALKVA